MRLIRHYISKEILFTFGATLIVLLAILLVQRLALMLNEVMSGGISPNVIFSMIGIQILRFIAELVPLSFLLASIVAFGRLYKDSEMTAMFALGMPLSTLYRLLFQITVPLAAILLLLNFFLIPHFSLRFHDIQQQAREEAQLTIIKAGTFKELSRGKNTVYVKEISENQQEIQDVFIKTQGENSEYSITLAKTGRQEIDPQIGTRFLILNDGNRYTFAKNGVVDILKFQEIILRLDNSSGYNVPKNAALSTSQLLSKLGDPNYKGYDGEFHRRLSAAISLLILTLMIPTLSHSNPRQGRFGNLLMAVFIYVVYFNLINLSQAWIRKGATPAALGMWWVHGIMLIIALFVAYRFSKRM